MPEFIYCLGGEDRREKGRVKGSEGSRVTGKAHFLERAQENSLDLHPIISANIADMAIV